MDSELIRDTKKWGIIIMEDKKEFFPQKIVVNDT